MSVTGTPETAPLRVGYPVCDTIGGHHRRLRDRRGAGPARAQTGEGECIDVSMLEATLVTMGWAVSNWLIAGVQPDAHGQREHDRGPLRRVPDRARPAQHRRQQAGAVRGAGPARRPAGSHHRSALRRPRGPQGQPLRAEDRARAGAGRAHGRRMGERCSTRPACRPARSCRCRRCSSTRRWSSAAWSSASPMRRASSARSPWCGRAFASPAAIPSRPRRRRALGADTDGILTELGYAADEIAALREQKAI